MIVREKVPFVITPRSLENTFDPIRGHKDGYVVRSVETYEVSMLFEVKDVDKTELLKRIGTARRIMESGV